MFGIGDPFFIQTRSPSNRRVLHPARIVGREGDVYSGEIEEAGFTLENKQEILVYFETRRDFLQQAATVRTVGEDTEGRTFDFVAVGEPASAESRRLFRVSAVISELTAALDDELGCTLLDVSSIGFAVLAKKQHDIGAMLDAELHLEGHRHAGQACVKSVHVLDRGRTRYGLHCVDLKQSDDNLAKGLWRMTMGLQRQQLRRLAGAVAAVPTK